MQLPVDFIHGMKGLLGESDYSLFFEALQQEPPVSIRLNTKFTSAQVNKYQSVSWCKNGYYLPSRPLFTADPLFHAGAYYVQEASSMFIEQIIKQLKDNSDLTEEMKNTDMLYWVGTMNAIKNQAEEIVFNELIYV